MRIPLLRRNRLAGGGSTVSHVSSIREMRPWDFPTPLPGRCGDAPGWSIYATGVSEPRPKFFYSYELIEKEDCKRFMFKTESEHELSGFLQQLLARPLMSAEPCAYTYHELHSLFRFGDGMSAGLKFENASLELLLYEHHGDAINRKSGWTASRNRRSKEVRSSGASIFLIASVAERMTGDSGPVVSMSETFSAFIAAAVFSNSRWMSCIVSVLAMLMAEQIADDWNFAKSSGKICDERAPCRARRNSTSSAASFPPEKKDLRSFPARSPLCCQFVSPRADALNLAALGMAAEAVELLRVALPGSIWRPPTEICPPSVAGASLDEDNAGVWVPFGWQPAKAALKIQTHRTRTWVEVIKFSSCAPQRYIGVHQRGAAGWKQGRQKSDHRQSDRDGKKNYRVRGGKTES